MKLLPILFMRCGIDGYERCDRRVIPSEVEGSRDVTFKLPHRDPSTSLGMTSVVVLADSDIGAFR